MDFFTDNFAREVWERKYKGDTSDVYDYYWYLANHISRGDLNLAARFFNLLWSKGFSPGGRILAHAGRKHARMSLMNCTTHTIPNDSLEAISDASYRIMRASSRGQGIGIDLSKLRPLGSPVNNAAEQSTGAISFMEMLGKVGATIGQLSRRAAILFSLDVSHPDLWRRDAKDVLCPTCNGEGCLQCGNGYLPYDFFHVKRIPGRIENTNISVMLSDAFMRTVVEDGVWKMIFKGDSGGSPFEIIKEEPAVDIFRELAVSAHQAAEPGILYWDTSKRLSNSDLFGDRWKIVGVNACSEETLDQDGVCNLGSMNLGAYVLSPFTDKASFDYRRFTEDVMIAVEFLDNVVSVEMENGHSISPMQRESLEYLRRTGLGIMGMADMIAKMKLPYGDHTETINLVRTVMRHFRDSAYQATINLAKEKGPAKVWETTGEDREAIVNGGFFDTLSKDMKQQIIEHGTRNVTVTSIAPTGSISNLLGISSGIEPLFATEYVRRTLLKGEETFVDYTHPGVRLSRTLGIPDDLWKTAYQVSPNDHLTVLATVQDYVDTSISKTVNFPKDATDTKIEDIYMQGWKAGLKGLSVYREGSREKQILYQKEESDKCPVCGQDLVHKDGCTECPACDYSVCSL